MATDKALRLTKRDQEVIDTLQLYMHTALQLGPSLRVPGAIVMAGMLINEGLHAVADAIEGTGDVEGSLQKIADAILI